MVLSKAIGIPNTVVRNGGLSDCFCIFFDMLVSSISQRVSVEKGTTMKILFVFFYGSYVCVSEPKITLG